MAKEAMAIQIRRAKHKAVSGETAVIGHCGYGRAWAFSASLIGPDAPAGKMPLAYNGFRLERGAEATRR
jgi:hypothetical protein